MFRISVCTVEMTACFDDGQISDFHQFKCRISENATIIRFRALFLFVLSGLLLKLLKVLTESVYIPKTESLIRKQHGTQCRCFAHQLLDGVIQETTTPFHSTPFRHDPLNITGINVMGLQMTQRKRLEFEYRLKAF